MGRFFLSYSALDGVEFALRLTDALEAGPPYYKVWIDKRDLRPGRDWDEQLEEWLRTCQAVLFVMTRDSVRDGSGCKLEWSRALKYGKQVIPLQVDVDAEPPFRLGSRQFVSFIDFNSGIAQLRQHLAWSASREGVLSQLGVRLSEVSRELRRAGEYERPALEARMRELRQQISRQQALLDSPIASPAPEVGRTGSVGDSTEYETSVPGSVESCLEALGISNQVGVEAHRLGAECISGSIVVDSAICDFGGVDLDDVVVRGVGELDDLQAHPAFISADRQASIEPTPNRPKVHLADWHAPVIDQGDVVTLDVARSDYWTSEATKRTISRIQREVFNGHIDYMRLPRRLDVHLVVVSGGDDMVLVARRGSHVATEPSTWMVSVGESMDWQQDRGPDEVPHPMRTAKRCLGERDELNLPRDLVESAGFRLIAVATEWEEMLINLIVSVRIPGVTFRGIRQFFRRGENLQLDAIPFELHSCAEFLREGSFAGSSGTGARMPISDISRFALLAALRSEYPLAEITG
ncbi:toll/interleukin-1 receptor domain-containing protein [Streptomyces sp. CL7]|uniref:toll/interleukin-1 receptor domain-containing protein n=1 Tax=Streptomyces sp. CL7 TaxID=3096006 RepID=UPI002A749E1E|nr:toll/interleukin-1 receptor domain-containing protein [Streptomyces sp. CL7]WPP33386.1 toll/interleukin-1 receptor domain-containing protein [Streptomyces sp. CL7]